MIPGATDMPILIRLAMNGPLSQAQLGVSGTDLLRMAAEGKVTLDPADPFDPNGPLVARLPGDKRSWRET